MKRLLIWWSQLFRRNALGWTIVSFVAVYAAFALLGGAVWLHVWLKGQAYWVYQAAFAIAFVAIQSIVIARQRQRPLSPVAFAMSGAVIGYVAGLLAYLAITLVMPYGADRLFRTMERSVSETLMIFVLPTILLNWLIGLVVGFLAGVASKSPASNIPMTYSA